MIVSALSLILWMIFLYMTDVLIGFSIHIGVTSNKVLDKVVTIVCCRFNTDDNVRAGKHNGTRQQ